MMRHSLLLAALLGSLLLGARFVVGTGRLVGSMAAPPRVYTMVAVRALLERDAGALVGRTLVVRALAEPCPWWGVAARLQHCAGRPPVLVGTPTDAPADPLPLARNAPQSLMALVRGLPILGDVLPQPPVAPQLVQARFRVRLRALPARSCAGHWPCYEAPLLDAAPGSL